MRIRKRFAVVLTLPLLATGCDIPGRSGGMENVSNGADSGDGRSWTVVAEGRPSPSPTRPTATPTPSATARPHSAAADTDPYCAFAWSAGQVLIPLTVVPAVNSVTVTWPRTGDPAPASYRVAAVPQRVVSGEQPEVRWRTVAASPGCRNTTTVTGLISGQSYVLWLDAPDSGYQPDGTPRPTHGRSAVFQAL